MKAEIKEEDINSTLESRLSAFRESIQTCNVAFLFIKGIMTHSCHPFAKEVIQKELGLLAPPFPVENLQSCLELLVKLDTAAFTTKLPYYLLDSSLNCEWDGMEIPACSEALSKEV